MVDDPVAARYADALFEVAVRDGLVDATREELTYLATLAREHEELRRFLVNPDVETADKIRVLDRLLRGAWSATTQAFVRTVIAMGRAAHLVAIGDAFGELVDAQRRLLRVTVRVAHPLPASLKQRLTKRLEARERCTVQLAEEVDPSLIGGLQVLMGHWLLDGSLKTQLSLLRHRLKSVRVH